MTLPDRALTLYQPYAWLVVHGHKPIENRPQGFSHKGFRGEFWVHAGACKDLEDPVLTGAWKTCRELCDQYLGIDFHLPELKALPFSAIVGRATITGIIPPVGLTIVEKALGIEPRKSVPWHFTDQYGFTLENAVALESPVPCRGHQAFWRVPGDVMTLLVDAA